MECTDKEWQHCRVEKMGCPGCAYDENKIEIGEYVRTREVYLGKVIAINEQDYNYLVIDTTREIRNDGFPATYLYLKNEDIVKHSKKIIVLITEGDILRYKLKGLKNEYITVVKKCYDARSNENWLLINGYKLEQVEILEILTKEQYTKNCFEVMQG